MFLKTVKQVKLEVRPLFLPQLVQLTSLLKPGLTRITVSHPTSLSKLPKLHQMISIYSSGLIRNGLIFMRNVKMPSKRLMCSLNVFMTFMPIAF